jgi:uncharacterized protein
MSDPKELVGVIAKSLVTKPDAVEVSEATGHQAQVVSLRVDPSDVGRVIGRQGRTARSIRTMLNVMGARSNKRYALDIVEEA